MKKYLILLLLLMCTSVVAQDEPMRFSQRNVTHFVTLESTIDPSHWSNFDLTFGFNITEEARMVATYENYNDWNAIYIGAEYMFLEFDLFKSPLSFRGGYKLGTDFISAACKLYIKEEWQVTKYFSLSLYQALALNNYEQSANVYYENRLGLIIYFNRRR